MKKTAQVAAAICRRRLLQVNSVSLAPSSFASRSPRKVLAGIAGGDEFAEALPIAISPIFFQNSFFYSRPRSISPDPRGGGNASDDEDWGVEWEEEVETEPVIGDGGDGGGVILGDVKWGEHALSLAREVLLSFGDDFAIYAFKVSPKGYIYVRLDKLTNRYGCPEIEEIENFNNLYKKRLDEASEFGAMPNDIALEVSSPGAERLLKVPRDLNRFQEIAMWVCYLDENQNPTERVLMLESVDGDAKHCIFKLAAVKENRAMLGKGRPLSKRLKDWRLNVPFKSILRIKLYLGS